MVEPTINSNKTPAKSGKPAVPAGTKAVAKAAPKADSKAVPKAAKVARPRAAKSEAGARAAAGATEMLPSPDERQRMISERAYLRAERRGFQGGDCVDDWLAAEAEVDGMQHHNPA